MGLAAAFAVCLLIFGGALDVTLEVHIPPAFLRRNPGAIENVLEIDIRKQDRDTVDPYAEPERHRKLQGLQLSHSRQPKYSIYTGEYHHHLCPQHPSLAHCKVLDSKVYPTVCLSHTESQSLTNCRGMFCVKIPGTAL